MKTTLNPFENAKRTANGTGGGVSPAVIEKMQAEISILGSQNKTQAQDITDIKGSLNSINDKLVKRTMATVSLSDGGAVGNVLNLFGIPLDSKVISLYVERGNLSLNRSYTLNMYGESGYSLNVYESGKPTTATSVTVSVFYIEP